MTLASVQQFSTTASSNTDVDGISCATGWPPSNVGPAFRELMALLASSLQPLSLNIAGQSAVTPTAAQASAQFIELTGALTGACTITLPNAFFVGIIQNNTTGGFAVNLTAGIGTTATVPADRAIHFYSTDGATNVALLQVGLSGAVSVPSLTVSGNASVGANLNVASTLFNPGTTQLGTINNLNPAAATLSVEDPFGLAAQFMSSINVPGATSVTVRNDRTDGISINFLFGAASVGSITQNGSTTSYNTTSDVRLKIDDGEIEPLWSGAVVDSLTPHFFRWKNQPDIDPQPGFFAQEVAPVYPWAVFRGRGEPGDENFRPMQLDDGKLMVAVIAELKALRRRVAELEAERV